MKSINYMYEPHILPDARSPYLYHADTVVTNSTMIANWHRNVEFLCFVAGSGRVICDGEVFQVKKGDIFIANSNCMHAIHADERVQYHCLIVDADFCEENGIDTDKIVFRPLINDAAAVEKYLKTAYEIENNNPFRNAGIKAAVMDFLVFVSRNHTLKIHTYETSLQKNVAENIKIATVYIRSHLSEKLTLEDIAAQTGLSKYHFAREFKKNVGLTTVSYINILRCEKARKMLSSGNCRIHEIQENCGFENASYFTKVFKKICGMTPARFIALTTSAEVASNSEFSASFGLSASKDR